jgi:hypothetical protein
MATKKNEVATTDQQKAIALPMDFMADLGAGMEGADKDSYAIPFLRVLQKTSPQCDEADAAYIDSARPGMFYNSVTNKLYDGKAGVTFLPCAFQRRFMRWAPRNAENGGFKGEYMPEDVAQMRMEGKLVEQDGRLFVPDSDGEVSDKRSDRMADTRSHFGLVVESDGGASSVVLPLTSTQIKKSKQLMSMLSAVKVQGPSGMVTPPTWLNRIKLTTVLESNDQGSWYGVRVEGDGFVDNAELYAAGKDFHAAIVAGEAKANYAEAEDVANPDRGGKF